MLKDVALELQEFLNSQDTKPKSQLRESPLSTWPTRSPMHSFDLELCINLWTTYSSHSSVSPSLKCTFPGPDIVYSLFTILLQGFSFLCI
jgi:hypothetical protein